MSSKGVNTTSGGLSFFFFQTKDNQAKPHPKSKHGQDNAIPALWIKNLTPEEHKFLANLDYVTRQNIFSDLSQVYAWTNPVSGFTLSEKIVDSI
jgi:hypothetical protein